MIYDEYKNFYAERKVKISFGKKGTIYNGGFFLRNIKFSIVGYRISKTDMSNIT